MNEELEKIKKVLKKYGQEHLLLKYDEMNDEQKKELLDQIKTIDFDLMQRLYVITQNKLVIMTKVLLQIIIISWY